MINFGAHLMIGFSGISPEDAEVRQIQQYLRDGLIGGVILFSHNIRNPTQVTELIQSFYEASIVHKPLIAVDQEGGRVQRLSSKNGFEDFSSAHHLARFFTPEQAYAEYKKMASTLKTVGFNVNFGPVVDLEYEESPHMICPVIGGIERSYSPDVSVVVQYAQAFIKAHREIGILTSLKHYPGHGFASQDSHKGLTDITASYRSIEEEPFKQLIEKGDADMVMIGHLINRSCDPSYPASLSPLFLKRLRSYYTGVTVSDDFFMGAIVQHFTLKEVLSQAIRAGIDLLVFSNNPAANLGKSEEHYPTPMMIV
jgi:beta-N-acetylhexosaminidase